MGACGVCMCGVGECRRGEGGGGRGQHCGKILSHRKCYKNLVYSTSVSNVSFDEIHCTVIT